VDDVSRESIPDAAPVRWGILSTAAINARILASARTSRDVQFVAVASRSKSRADRYAREHGVAQAYGSYESLLEDPAVEALYVSLPNALHVEWSIRALEAGKHVLCEKPLSRSPSDLQRAFQKAQDVGRVLSEAFMFRHHPQTLRWASLVHDGAIGRLCLIRASLSFSMATPGADIRTSRDLGGGALMDVGAYCVSASRLLAGEPVSAQGEQVLEDGEVDLRFVGTLRFPGGVLAQFDCAMVLPRHDALEIVGTEGTIVVTDPWHCRASSFMIRREYSIEEIHVPAADAYRLELENISGAIRGLCRPRLDAGDALGQARAIDALYRAADAGRSVDVAETSHHMVVTESRNDVGQPVANG
jgi:D-xylose 1-dehydrogenase (NADP+, D-xylono-1,5-lactone-forming)